MMKLKARKTLTKEPREKIKNQDNKDRNEKKNMRNFN